MERETKKGGENIDIQGRERVYLQEERVFTQT